MSCLFLPNSELPQTRKPRDEKSTSKHQPKERKMSDTFKKGESDQILYSNFFSSNAMFFEMRMLRPPTAARLSGNIERAGKRYRVSSCGSFPTCPRAISGESQWL